ncbi:ribonuclease H family protein [Rhizobium mesosinicum]|uniref:ribonuclease H family protein n=1 Tax=Rhizobium mesosinicum TaxID=335017 RepID=UPI001CB76D71|nr:ribonuclease H [Rhizobium mesosinicum]
MTRRSKANGPTRYVIDHGAYLVGLHVFCDGACEPNPGPGGWAFVAYDDGAEIFSAHGNASQTTNNVMEMTGALQAILWISANAADRQARLHCDSQYVVKGCNEWRHSWKRKNWMRGVNAPVKNLELWQELDAALLAFPLTLSWVKGHAGVMGNERADELSFAAARAAGSSEIAVDHLTAAYRQIMARN